MRSRKLLSSALVLAALVSGRALAQDVPVDLEIGYRWLDVTGNKDMYRTQVNERDGILLKNLTFSLGDIRNPTFIDSFRIDAADFGAGPSGSVRLEAGRTSFWKARVTYRRDELFSALPAFANPLLDSTGVIPGQHTEDRTRNMVDVDVEILPGGVITPLLGYTLNKYEGPGRTTYHIGEDEFRLEQGLDDKDQEFRVGLAFNAGPVWGQVTQGWRQYSGTENLSLVSGAGAGNNPGTVLGTPVTLTSFRHSTSTDVDTPVTNAMVAWKVIPALKISGMYVRTKGDSDTSSREDASGSLVSFELSRFFAGLAGSVSSSASATFWRGSGRADIHIADGIDVTAGYTKRNRTVDGFALISDLYSSTTSWIGMAPGDITAILQANTSLERDESIFDVAATAKGLGPISLRAGWSENKADITVRNDASEVVASDNGQGGSFSRRVRRFDGSASMSLSVITLGVDYRRESADTAVMRTDFLTRDRLRVRLGLDPTPWLHVGGTAEGTDYDNDGVGSGYTGKGRQYAGDLEIGPADFLRGRLSIARYESSSDIPVVNPYPYAVVNSGYEEKGDTIDGGVMLHAGPVLLDASVGRLDNGGTFPFTMDRVRVRAEFQVHPKVGLVGTWDNDKYREMDRSYGSLADYDGNRYGFFIRFRQ